MKLYEFGPFDNVRQIIENAVSKHGDCTAFHVKNHGKIEKISFNQMYAHVKKLGNYLISQKYTRVALVGKSCYNLAIAYLSIVCSNICIVPIDKDLMDEDILGIVRSGEVDCIIGEPKYLEMIDDNVCKIDLYQISTLGCDETFYDDVIIDNNKMSFLLFTSGTTGASKGVMLSHSNIASNVVSVNQTVMLYESDVALSVLPMHHTYESTLGLITILSRGASICYCDGLKHIGKNMLEYRPTIMVVVPLLLESVHKKILKTAEKTPGGALKLKAALAAANLLGTEQRRNLFKDVHASFGGRLRMFVVGAAAVAPTVSHTFSMFGIKVLQGYGLTECSPLAVGNNDKVQHDDAIGFAIPSVQVRLDNLDAAGIGEICVKGPNVMLGYYKNPEETARVINNGWFHTGDLATQDKRGVYRICGRIKNVIVTKNGKNIYPEELEYHLQKSPLVCEAVVLGKETETGEAIVTAHIFPNLEAVHKKLGTTTPSDNDIRALLEAVVKNVNKSLPLYKKIYETRVYDKEFEKTTTKKILRRTVGK